MMWVHKHAAWSNAAWLDEMLHFCLVGFATLQSGKAYAYIIVISRVSDLKVISVLSSNRGQQTFSLRTDTPHCWH